MSIAQFLFRQEVIEKQLRQRDGQIHLSRASYTTALLLAALAIMIATALFIGFGAYTKRTAVSGATVPDLGLLKIIPNPSGTIATIHVADGQAVKKGQLLYTVRATLPSAFTPPGYATTCHGCAPPSSPRARCSGWRWPTSRTAFPR